MAISGTTRRRTAGKLRRDFSGPWRSCETRLVSGGSWLVDKASDRSFIRAEGYEDQVVLRASRSRCGRSESTSRKI